MKQLRYIILPILLMLLATSCDKYLDVNADPDAPTQVSPDNRIKPLIRLANGAAQWRGTREVSDVMQYVASYQAARSYDIWNYTASYYFWQNTLVWAYPNAADLILLGKETNSPNFSGVGEIFKSFLILSLSDQLGRMPWDDLYDGVQETILMPRFEDQKTVYEKALATLDQAIVDLSATDNAIALNNRDGDILYQGDTQKWIKFAYALKARYLNHYSKKSNLYDPDAVIDACSKAFDGDGMDAEFAYSADGSSTDANPWSVEGYGGFSSLTAPRYGGYSAFFVNMLKSSPLADSGVDPRLPIIMKPANNTGEYTGIVNGRGLDTDKTLDDYSNVPGGYYSSADSPFPFITYSEVKFIEAEARLRKNDITGAISAFKEGVLANMRKLGVSSDAIAEATTKMDALTTADFTSGGDITSGLSYIMTQKYIAMVFNPETWVDMRRMDYSTAIYPNLSRPENVYSIFQDGEWIRAMCYEINEQNRNEANLGDNRPEVRLKTPVWWDTAE
ncbi:hypothetical protein PbJCM13498_14090 [Prolixibacter bellariivorans]|uniref:SusD/RagB family nutrient-binding outer membrane lipoprotein n=1 Tax=Prolixibacter bellariivorans TaxID=314319 RepID=A0A5M4AY86_9BACT|nr:SusD/RagB family nutrient-binding outer membrane lipoprotein [Prolixibacter bellariivorans]GET32546.1 hypothetical protein PbJCM13498_14090 [Prolixibacter bellariivorans]